MLAKPGWQLTISSHCSNAKKVDSSLWPKKDTMYLTFGTECKALGDAQNFELRQCHFDCPWLIEGTKQHELVLCTNMANLPGQHIEGNAMQKGVVPAGVFRQIFKSHTQQRRQSKQTASAAVAAVRTTEQKDRQPGPAGPKSGSEGGWPSRCDLSKQSVTCQQQSCTGPSDS